MRDPAISYRDLEFDHYEMRLCPNSSFGLRRRVPVGMPRVSEHLQRCVFFLFQHNPNGAGFVGPEGTGFFVARDSELFGLKHLYAVSNRHVVNPASTKAKGGPASTIRINTRDGGSEYIPLDPSEWEESKTDDVAVVDLTDHFPPIVAGREIPIPLSWIEERSFVDHPSKEMVFKDAAIGDQTVMLGLFTDYNGGEVNIPVGRFGNLAAIPNEKAPIRLWEDDPLVRPAFLNDIRSRAGFSGSPVWAWYSMYDDIMINESGGVPQPVIPTSEPRRHALFTFLGLHRGQFFDPPVEKGQTETKSSMTVVVPAWEITKLLDSEKLRKRRKESDADPKRIAASENYKNLRKRLER